MKKPDGSHIEIIPTLCDRCHCSCGVLAHVRDGKVVKVEGDPSFPQNEGFMCPKGLAVVQFLNHPDRLRYPMKRVGARGEWERLSWDEALDMAAAGFKAVIEKYGPETVTWSWGDVGFHSHAITKQAWLYAMGSPTHFHSDAHYCHSPVLIANAMVFGDRVTSEEGPDYRNSRCIMLWGGNPVASHPTRARDIMIGKKRGAKLIVIDPRMTEIAAKADLFLQLRPSTDDALCLAILNVIISEGIYDKEFVARWCLGFEELRERVSHFPPEMVSEITWVPADDIVRAARTYALNRPATVHTRVGVQMSIKVNETIRAVSILAAICGNLDVKGGHIFPERARAFKSRATVTKEHLTLPPEKTDIVIGAKEFPLFSGTHSMVGNYTHPPSTIHAMITGEPYPIKALWAQNDLLLALEDTMETRKALDHVEFLVGSDFFMTPQLALCDLILPPCSYLSRDEVEYLFYNNFIGARRKVVEPEFSLPSDRTIDLEVIRRMGYEVPEVVKTIEAYNDYQLKDMGITFKQLNKRRFVREDVRYKKYEEIGFNTPSGKVELYSTLAERYGYDPLPSYRENPETPLTQPETAKEYPLVLITGARNVAYFHGSNRQIPWLRELFPRPTVEIHPGTAEKLGIREGDEVWIEAPHGRGRVKMWAELTEAVDPRVVSAPSHWWFPERKEDKLRGVYESNINVIMSNDPPYDPVSGATPIRGNLCKVYKV